MTYLQLLKSRSFSKDSRWIVKWDNCSDCEIREIKLIWDPKEYSKSLKARRLYNQKELIKILEDDKEKRKSQ